MRTKAPVCLAENSAEQRRSKAASCIVRLAYQLSIWKNNNARYGDHSHHRLCVANVNDRTAITAAANAIISAINAIPRPRRLLSPMSRLPHRLATRAALPARCACREVSTSLMATLWQRTEPRNEFHTDAI